MISSLILLIILQIFWLKSSYEKAFYDFRREASILFRTTVLEMRDSLLAKNIETVPAAALHTTDSGNAIFQIRTDSLHWRTEGKERKTMYAKTREQNTRVQVFVAQGDSIDKDVLKPLASKIQHLTVQGRNGGNKSFIIRITPDTLNRDSLKARLENVFARADIEVPFVVHSITEPSEDEGLPGLLPPQFRGPEKKGLRERAQTTFGDSVETEPVRMNPLQKYSASFFHVRRALLAEITPQILFSLFIVIMISGAFILMYRNIKAQQRLMEQKNDFISNVTHELKTPVATVSVALEALKNFRAMDDPKVAEEYLDMAQRELNRLTLMTEKILNASVFESKGIEFSPEKVDINELLNDVLESNKVIFEKRDAEVTVTRTGMNFETYGSGEHLRSVIYNLIDNALKYSPGKPVIHVYIKESDREINLMVKDQGIGIPAEYQKKVFEKFFRVPTGDVHNIKGYGLGLSHVASIIESHKGTLDVTSEPGKGSEFRITLKKPSASLK
jgi:two-component system phosphate regulon sensor histidine kinase PhoR